MWICNYKKKLLYRAVNFSLPTFSFSTTTRSRVSTIWSDYDFSFIEKNFVEKGMCEATKNAVRMWHDSRKLLTNWSILETGLILEWKKSFRMALEVWKSWQTAPKNLINVIGGRRRKSFSLFRGTQGIFFK